MMHVVYGLDDMACRMQASRFLCLQVPTERFVLEVVDKHTASAAEFVHRFQAPCACVGRAMNQRLIGGWCCRCHSLFRSNRALL